MGLEKAKNVEQLQDIWPLPADKWNQGDDHLRNIKYCLKNQFPGKNGNGFNKAITATEDELNFLAGVTSPVQEQFNDLPTKYVLLTGSDMTGPLSVFHEIRVLTDNIDPLTGFVVTRQSGAQILALVADTNDLSSFLYQSSDGGAIDTAVRFKAGNITVSSPRGWSTDPLEPTDLTTKQWVEAQIAAAIAAL